MVTRSWSEFDSEPLGKLCVVGLGGGGRFAGRLRGLSCETTKQSKRGRGVAGISDVKYQRRKAVVGGETGVSVNEVLVAKSEPDRGAQEPRARWHSGGWVGCSDAAQGNDGLDRMSRLTGS